MSSPWAGVEAQGLCSRDPVTRMMCPSLSSQLTQESASSAIGNHPATGIVLGTLRSMDPPAKLGAKQVPLLLGHMDMMTVLSLWGSPKDQMR